jgi:carbonic anhydrase
VHGWIYGIGDGLLRDLGFTVAAGDGARQAYESALHALGGA